MTGLYPCNPHYTSRSPEGESLEVTGLKMLLTPLTNTWTRDCRVSTQLCTKMQLSFCLSVCLSVCPQAAFLTLLHIRQKSLGRSYKVENPYQSQKGRERRRHVVNLSLVTSVL